MRPRQLSQFLAICRHETVSAAAQELGIAQPALSKQILQLEHELQTPLFHRHSRGVTLTKAGELLKVEATELLRRIETLKTTIKHGNTEVSGNVVLAVIRSLAPALAVELYPRIEQEHPNISLHITDFSSEEAGQALVQHKADLAIMPATSSDLSHAMSLPLFEEEFYFLSRASPGMRTTAIPFSFAVEKPLVLPLQNHDLRRRLEDAARNLGLELNIKYETSSINIIGELIEQGLACGIVPTTYWLDRISAGRLAARAINGPTVSRVQSLCWLSDQELSPAAAVVREIIQFEIKALVSGGKLSGRLAVL